MNKENLKVLYDHQIFELQQYGGVSRYFSEIITRFIRSSQITPNISISITNNQFIHKIEPKFLIPEKTNYQPIKRSESPDPYLSTPRKIAENCRNLMNNYRLQAISTKNKENTIQVLQSGDYDIFHPTYFDPYFLPYLNKKPYVLTVYDLIHEKYPELYPLQDNTIHNRKKLIENASIIIAISKNTKQDILQFYNVKPENISVIYLGNEHIKKEYTSSIQNNIKLPFSFFLYVGDRRSYKNFIFTLEAIAPILRTSNHHLVCYGGGKLSNGELYFIQHLGLQDKVLQISGDDNILIQCYNQAIALIYPSLYEGFGIPIIEAFHEECPVITSNIPTSHEIAGEAAVYFDPKDPISIQNALNKVSSDQQYRDELIKAGVKRSKLFSWDITAEKTKEIYVSLVSRDN
jgi:glycosyltransferase involved in cell wall biosynthesis